MASFVFLDRDGVINADSPDFIKDVQEWRALPGSLEAIARLVAAGIEVVVLTNQSGIARGLYSVSTLEAIHHKMRTQVEAAGGRLAGIFVCPHGPDADCACRKPRPGLIEQACAKFGIAAMDVPFVGDRVSDLAAARAAGCRPVLISPSRSLPAESDGTAEAWSDVSVYPDLLSFVEDWLEA